jgi:radical SAM superfamily enzyme YgiQ (UPF0313 family)
MILRLGDVVFCTARPKDHIILAIFPYPATGVSRSRVGIGLARTANRRYIAFMGRKKTAGNSVLEHEYGTILREAGIHLSLGYPASYRVGASSLGAQTVYRCFNDVPGLACSRFYLPGKGQEIRPLLALETGRPVSESNALAFSVACETDLYGVVALLDAAGYSPLREQRTEDDPLVIIGGPLTAIDPRLVAPLADMVVVGEAERAVPAIGAALARGADPRAMADSFASAAGIWVPDANAEPPGPAEAPIDLLPARAATWSAEVALKNLFLVEATRGCKRGCAFCVLSARARSAPRFRPVPMERILSAIPDAAPGVGLVGAAVTDHPDIERLVSQIVESGRRVSLSSVRADRLTTNLLRALRRGGLRTLTVAADGSSDRLRKVIHKGITAEDLTRAAQLAAAEKLSGIKIYSMVGLPGEREDDLLEFAGLMTDLSRIIKINVALQAFVPKPGTPLESAPMTSVREIDSRIATLKRALKGRVRLAPTSPKWSWLDWVLVRGGERSAHAAVEAYRLGGGFSSWRKALVEVGLDGR